MKTDKKSLVPLFTFPPPLLAALFLLAGCHYKALQGMVRAIGVGHRATWCSPMFQTPWHAHALTHKPFQESHVLSLSHARTCTQGCAHTYVCIYVHGTDPNTQSHKHNHTEHTYILYIHTSGCTPRYRTYEDKHTTHTRLHKGTCIRTCTRARSQMCTQGLGGTQARIVKSSKVIQCRK